MATLRMAVLSTPLMLVGIGQVAVADSIDVYTPSGHDGAVAILTPPDDATATTDCPEGHDPIAIDLRMNAAEAARISGLKVTPGRVVQVRKGADEVRDIEVAPAANAPRLRQDRNSSESAVDGFAVGQVRVRGRLDGCMIANTIRLDDGTLDIRVGTPIGPVRLNETLGDLAENHGAQLRAFFTSFVFRVENASPEEREARKQEDWTARNWYNAFVAPDAYDHLPFVGILYLKSLKFDWQFPRLAGGGLPSDGTFQFDFRFDLLDGRNQAG